MMQPQQTFYAWLQGSSGGSATGQTPTGGWNDVFWQQQQQQAVAGGM
jgi:hypothetical protein